MNNTTILLTRTVLSAVSQIADTNTDSNFTTLLPFIIILIGIGGASLLISNKPEYFQEFILRRPRNPSAVVFNHDDDLPDRRGVDIPLQQIVRHSSIQDSDESFGNRGILPNVNQNNSNDSDHFTDVDLNSSDHSSNAHYQELRSQIDFNSNINNEPVRPDSTVPTLTQRVNQEFSGNVSHTIDLGDPANLYDSFGF